MAGESLQDFDEQLCDYVIGNIRNAARPPRQRRRKSSKPDQGVGPNEFAAWLKANLSAPLASLIFAEEVFELGNPTKDGPQRILLNDDEFDALALAVFADVPELDRFWEPDDELHRRHVLCVPEIRRHISDSAAKQWCSDSDEFAEALSEERLHLCDGIEIVKRWTRRLRRLLVAMGADDLVPRPVGNHPTPTTSERAASGQKVPPHLMEYVAKARAFFKNEPASVHDKPDVVIKKICGTRKNLLLALRWLEARNEYLGFARSRRRKDF